MSDEIRIKFDASGVLHLRGALTREPVCFVCGEPVRWVLDMASFTAGAPHRLAHARCVWQPEAFTREARAAAGGRS